MTGDNRQANLGSRLRRAKSVEREACGVQSWQTQGDETGAETCQTDSETIASS